MNNIIENEDNDNSNFNKYIVKIETEVKIKEELKYITGIGVLCNINMKHINALITYNNIIDFDLLNEMKILRILINNEEKEINMKIDRYKYSDDIITIIEILNEDNINNFIEIDKFINSKNYINNDIICIYLKDNNKLEYLNDKIKIKNNDNYMCNINEFIKEGIIILKDNLKLLGIINKNNNKNEIDIITMNIIINKINFIKCKYEIKKDDVGKEIQIISGKNSYGEYKNKEILKEMKIIINGEIKSNITYKFNKEGIYIIYLLSFNLLTNMSWMFCDCSSLKEINLQSFNTNQVTDMSWMFCDCSSLIEINLQSFNTNQVTNMSYMFNGCSSLKEINLQSFNTNQVTNISWMFNGCSSLKEINLQSFNTNQVTDMSSMFNGCSSLKEIKCEDKKILGEYKKIKEKNNTCNII